MKYLVAFFLLSSLSSLAQVRLPANELGQVQYQEIVKVADGKQTARQVIAQARAWADEHYPSEATTEKHFDEENSILFIKTTSLVGHQQLRYTLTIEAKYGRYRATIIDLITESDGLSLPVRPTSSTAEEIAKTAGNKPTTQKLVAQTVAEQTELYHQINKLCRSTLASLKETMLQLR